MKISTKGRYALKIMLALTKYEPNTYTNLKELSDVSGVTIKYLEQIITLLKNASLLRSYRGKDGGYCLSRRPDDYNLLEIITAAEGSLAPIDALERGGGQDADDEVMYVWQGLYDAVKSYLSGISLQDVRDRADGTDMYVYNI